VDGHGAINDTARALFAPLGGDYDRWATILSFAQDPRWRRFLVEHVPVGADARVLDVATGTGAIARALVRRYGCRVVGVDQSPQMLDGARERIEKAGLADRIELRLGSAEELDFAEGSFDALTTGYLVRYLDDPLRTLTDLLRLVRPGGPFALLDFAVPPNVAARGLWHVYTGVGLPVLGRLVSPGWGEVGRYLRPSITAFGDAYPPGALRELLTEAGGANVQTRLLSLGGGLVAWGVRAVR
jgi:demethylmenaquinone methyltransferase/2-methoxy-6-polyprenyl-1,4-benzoquinol methylase